MRFQFPTWPLALSLAMLNHANAISISWFWVVGVLFLSEILTVVFTVGLWITAVLSVGKAKEERRKAA